MRKMSSFVEQIDQSFLYTSTTSIRYVSKTKSLQRIEIVAVIREESTIL